MDDNTIFGGSNPPAGPINSAPTQPVQPGQSPVVQPPVTQPSLPQEPTYQPPQPPQVQSRPAPSPFPQPVQQSAPQPVAVIPKPIAPMQGATIPQSPLPPGMGVPPPAPGGPAPSAKRSPLLFIGIAIVIIIGIILAIIFFLMPRFQGVTGGKVTLTYWGLFETEEVMKPIIAEFEKQNPNIKVKYVHQDIKAYRERLNTRIQNGNGPDIFRFHNTWVSMMSSSLLPLSNDVITKKDFETWYYTVAQRDLIKKGAIYGIPLEIDTLALYINTDLLQAAGVQPPKTWDEFLSVSRALTVRDNGGRIKTAGAALGTYDNVDHAPDIMSLLLLQNGANLKDLSQTVQNTSDAFAFYLSFSQIENRVWDDALDSSRLSFSRGNLAMFFGYSWDAVLIKAENPNLQFRVYPVPHLLDRSITIASYWAEGVSAKSLHKNESLKFMKFLTLKETQQKLFTEESKTRLYGEPYSRVDLADSLKDNELLYPFVAQAKDSSSSFFASDTDDGGLNTQANGYLGNAVRSSLGGLSPETAIKTLTHGVKLILSQYGEL